VYVVVEVFQMAKYTIRAPGCTAWATTTGWRKAIALLHEAQNSGLTRARIYREFPDGSVEDHTGELMYN
jgi:hypothetical protein